MTAATAEAPAGLTVRVEAFEGPLDLLLHLCRTHEVDLARLPVRTITDQYLAHLESVRFQDLEMAGGFMVMAATLIYLKSKLLVPDTEGAQDDALDEEGELPPPEEIPLEDLSVHLLQRAMTRLIQAQKQQAPREVDASPISILERMAEIVSLLRHTWSLLFSSVVGSERARSELVVTLLALLELVRLGQARARQGDLFSDIVIERRTPEAETIVSATAPEAGGDRGHG